MNDPWVGWAAACLWLCSLFFFLAGLALRRALKKGGDHAGEK